MHNKGKQKFEHISDLLLACVGAHTELYIRAYTTITPPTTPRTPLLCVPQSISTPGKTQKRCVCVYMCACCRTYIFILHAPRGQSQTLMKFIRSRLSSQPSEPGWSVRLHRVVAMRHTFCVENISENVLTEKKMNETNWKKSYTTKCRANRVEFGIPHWACGK